MYDKKKTEKLKFHLYKVNVVLYVLLPDVPVSLSYMTMQ